MLISEYAGGRDDILAEAAKELRRFEIKIRFEKQKHGIFEQNKHQKKKKIFKIPLSQQILENCVFSNGQCSVVPRFVLQACQKIQKESKTEGIFRKTGSVKKQVEIREHIEQRNGSLNDKNFNVIDVANLLKTYFRELPEPLIPQGTIQDSLIKCLIYCSKYEEKVDAILLTCLFLPSITLNTLAYFLQFLQVIIKNSSENFMTLENLVKVLTPTIMPLPLNAPEKRLQSHFKVIELLIENANLIGVIPDRMIKRDEVFNVPMTEERKKKKRRSGSLNRVFSNFKKKIVGSLGSSESLDKSHENTLEDVTMMTPNVTKSAKKRRLDKLDLSAFGSRKKKDALMKLTSLPEIDDSSPYAPRKTEQRVSLGEQSNSKSTASPRRRHSLAPNTLTRNKHVVPLQEKMVEDNQVEDVVDFKEEEYIRVPKAEYEAFKTRINTIETKMTHEFNAAKLNAIKAEYGRKNNTFLAGQSVEDVENKFHETLLEVEKIEDSERKTEQLAKRLSRELKIRPSVGDNPIIRSPSARKIGSLRRRRESTTRLSRNQSWHLGPSTLVKSAPKEETIENKTLTSSLSFYPKPALKRARLVDSALITQEANPLPSIPQSTEKVIPEKPVRKTVNNTASSSISTEIWTPATDFFNDPKNASSNDQEMMKIQQNDIGFKTPNRPAKKFTVAPDVIDLNNTPMLPPKITPARCKMTPMSDKKTPAMNKTIVMTPSMLNDNSREARASIIQIRNQNAGMVAQKAKLFDDLNKSADRSIKIPRVIVNKKLESVKSMSDDLALPQKKSSKQNSPRRSSRSPGVNRRMNLRISSTQSPVLKTIKENADKGNVQILTSEVLNEIASPRNRKVFSQNNTPRRKSKTPRSSSKKHRTPNKHASKSPRQIRRHQISFD